MSAIRRNLLILACWAFVALFFAAHIAIGSRAVGRPASFLEALAVYGTCSLVWYGFTPLVVRISRRFRVAAPHAVRNSAVHVGASLLFALASFTLFALLSPFTVGAQVAQRPLADRLTSLFAFNLHLELIRYFAVVAIEHTISYHRQARERETALAQARLEVLKRQIHPHFLFNTLNSISVLMFEDVKVANRMLLQLSELLRSGLTDDSPHEVSLQHELSFLDRYLEIERMRFGDRLTVDMNVDQNALGASVPNLLLQPIVENAIRYGVATVDRQALVAISAQRQGDMLHVQVRDDGPGMAGDARRGVGLSNTEARLRQLYGDEQTLELSPADGGGVLVSIAFPFRAAATV